jgi:four helix bundle protein
MGTPIRSHFELDVFKKAVEIAMSLFDFSKTFPREELYSLTDQMRRSSRSVCANVAEAWRKRIYEAAFVSKINDAEAEAAEAQNWIMFAVRCGYLNRDAGLELHNRYEEVLRMLVAMRTHPEQWIIRPDER